MSRGLLSRVPAVWLVLAAILSIQLGAAAGKSLFSVTHPVAITWLRLLFAALVLVPLTRPRLRGRTHAEWTILLSFAAALTTMNTVIYLAFQQVPIGIAVTLEFLGPLAVALAGSRRWLDLVWVALATTGVAVLGLSRGTAGPVHLVGALLALAAGAMWAAYIVLGQRLGRTWSTPEALGLSCGLGAVALAVPAILLGSHTVATPHVLVVGAVVALASTIVPYSLELVALQRLPMRVFSILMSLEPAVAALAALLVLGERLTSPQWLAMSCVIAASAGATWFARQNRRRQATLPP